MNVMKEMFASQLMQRKVLSEELIEKEINKRNPNKYFYPDIDQKSLEN